jgi:uncharacterized protein YggE
LKKLGVIAVVAAAVALVGLLPTFAQAQEPPLTPVPEFPEPGNFPVNTITVTGIGTASAEPDTAYLELGVEIVNEDLAAAYTEASDKLTQITAALVDLGIDANDIRTSSVNVYPQDQYDQNGQMSGRTYRVSSTLRIKVADVSMVSDVIDTAVNAGANTIYSFNFAIEDTAGLEEQARQQAVANAKDRAQQLADALGVTVGNPVVISESYGSQTPPIPYASGGGYDMAVAQSASLPVASGQLDVTVQILVTFAISPAS